MQFSNVPSNATHFEHYVGIVYTYPVHPRPEGYIARLLVPTMHMAAVAAENKITAKGFVTLGMPFPQKVDAAVNLDLFAIQFFGPENCRRGAISKEEAETRLYQLRVPDDPRVVAAMLRATAAGGTTVSPTAVKRGSAVGMPVVSQAEQAAGDEAFSTAKQSLALILAKLYSYLAKAVPAFGMPSAAAVLAEIRATYTRSLPNQSPDAIVVCAFEAAQSCLLALEGLLRGDSALLHAALAVVAYRAAPGGSMSLAALQQTFSALEATSQWADVAAAARSTPGCTLVDLVRDALQEALAPPPSSPSASSASASAALDRLNAHAGDTHLSETAAPLRDVGEDRAAASAIRAALVVVEGMVPGELVGLQSCGAALAPAALKGLGQCLVALQRVILGELAAVTHNFGVECEGSLGSAGGAVAMSTAGLTVAARKAACEDIQGVADRLRSIQWRLVPRS